MGRRNKGKKTKQNNTKSNPLNRIVNEFRLELARIGKRNFKGCISNCKGGSCKNCGWRATFMFVNEFIADSISKCLEEPYCDLLDKCAMVVKSSIMKALETNYTQYRVDGSEQAQEMVQSNMVDILWDNLLDPCIPVNVLQKKLFDFVSLIIHFYRDEINLITGDWILGEIMMVLLGDALIEDRHDPTERSKCIQYGVSLASRIYHSTGIKLYDENPAVFSKYLDKFHAKCQNPDLSSYWLMIPDEVKDLWAQKGKKIASKSANTIQQSAQNEEQKDDLVSDVLVSVEEINDMVQMDDSTEDKISFADKKARVFQNINATKVMTNGLCQSLNQANNNAKQQQRRFQELENRHKKLQAKLQKVTENHDKLRKRNETLENDKTSIYADNKKLKNELENVTSENNAFQQEIKNLKSRLDTYKDKDEIIDTLSIEMETLKVSNNKLSSQIQSSTATKADELKKANAKIQKMRKKNDKLKREQRTLKDKLEAATANKDSLEQRDRIITELSIKIDTLKQSNNKSNNIS